MRYHGNYCGPYWSGGKYQGSIRYGEGPDAIDEFDETCRWHDDAYARNSNLKEADYKFYKQNIGRGIKRSAAAIAVGVQGFFRSSKKNNNSENTEMAAAPRGRKRQKMDTPASRSRSRSRSVSVRTPSRAPSRPPMSITSSRSRSRALSILAGRTPVSQQVSTSSAGFFKGGNREQKKKYSYYATKGTILNLEYGGQTSDINTTIIGHSTCSQQYMALIAAKAILKKFLTLMQKMPVDQEDSPFSVPVGAQFVIDRKDTYDDDTITPVIIGVPGNSFRIIAQNLQNQLLSDNNQRQFIKMYYQESGGTAAKVMHLKNAKLEFTVKSTLKIQNRTLANESEDSSSTDVVDATPLYGKSYEGNGTGTNYVGKVGSTGEVVADRFFAVIDKVPGGINSLQEPPIGKLFTQVKKMAKAHLEPGQIKTSVLTENLKTNLNTFMHRISGSALDSKQFLKIGKFRFFGFEKMIESQIARPPILVGWEHNYFIGCVCSPGHQTVTTTDNFKFFK